MVRTRSVSRRAGGGEAELPPLFDVANKKHLQQYWQQLSDLGKDLGDHQALLLLTDAHYGDEEVEKGLLEEARRVGYKGMIYRGGVLSSRMPALKKFGLELAFMNFVYDQILHDADWIKDTVYDVTKWKSSLYINSFAVEGKPGGFIGWIRCTPSTAKLLMKSTAPRLPQERVVVTRNDWLELLIMIVMFLTIVWLTFTNQI